MIAARGRTSRDAGLQLKRSR